MALVARSLFSAFEKHQKLLGWKIAQDEIDDFGESAKQKREQAFIFFLVLATILLVPAQIHTVHKKQDHKNVLAWVISRFVCILNWEFLQISELVSCNV